MHFTTPTQAFAAQSGWVYDLRLTGRMSVHINVDRWMIHHHLPPRQTRSMQTIFSLLCPTFTVRILLFGLRFLFSVVVLWRFLVGLRFLFLVGGLGHCVCGISWLVQKCPQVSHMDWRLDVMKTDALGRATIFSYCFCLAVPVVPISRVFIPHCEMTAWFKWMESLAALVIS